MDECLDGVGTDDGNLGQALCHHKNSIVGKTSERLCVFISASQLLCFKLSIYSTSLMKRLRVFMAYRRSASWLVL